MKKKRTGSNICLTTSRGKWLPESFPFARCWFQLEKKIVNQLLLQALPCTDVQPARWSCVAHLHTGTEHVTGIDIAEICSLSQKRKRLKISYRTSSRFRKAMQKIFLFRMRFFDAVNGRIWRQNFNDLVTALWKWNGSWKPEVWWWSLNFHILPSFPWKTIIRFLLKIHDPFIGKMVSRNKSGLIPTCRIHFRFSIGVDFLTSWKSWIEKRFPRALTFGVATSIKVKINSPLQVLILCIK